MPSASDSSFRKCANVKSRSHSDVRCTLVASQGDFCHRHFKNPVRYLGLKRNETRVIYTRSQSYIIVRIQKWWNSIISDIRWRRQGPAIHDRSLSQNDYEVYSMEPIASIPKLFFFSYTDPQKNIWSFDIRSLIHMFSQGQILQNPYTREPFPEAVVSSFRARHDWLRARKYVLFYGVEETITAEQEWNQKVLDVFMRIEALGYLLSTSWFQELTLANQQSFYRHLFQLWFVRLGLSSAQREEVCPKWSQGETRIFKKNPDETEKSHKDIKWWRKQNLALIESLVSRGQLKSSRGLGAMYVLMALVQVSEQAAEAYPWIYESV